MVRALGPGTVLTTAESLVEAFSQPPPILEVHSCAQEHISSRIGAARLTKGGVLQLCIDSHEVDSIEEVERIQPQLQVDALSDTCCLLQRKVSVSVPRIEEPVRRLVPFRPEGR